MAARHPPWEPQDEELVRRVLHEAFVKLGGEKSLAHHLGVSVGIVHMWLAGRAHPTYDAFLKCVDLLEDDAPPKS
jgi:hypothetical protein